MTPQHLNELVHQSIVKDFNGQPHRYFPLNVSTCNPMEYLKQAYYILYGEHVIDDDIVFHKCVTSRFDHKIEGFDGKLWVRTICVE